MSTIDVILDLRAMYNNVDISFEAYGSILKRMMKEGVFGADKPPEELEEVYNHLLQAKEKMMDFARKWNVKLSEGCEK